MILNSKKLAALVVAGMALSLMVPVAGAQENKLGVTLDGTVVTQYIWRGYDKFDDHGAFHPSVDFDLFGTGFSLGVWGAIPIGTSFGDGLNTYGGINSWQEYDYTLRYDITLMEDEAYALDVFANYIYFHYPKRSHVYDGQELGGGIAMPKLIPIGPKYLVPSYYVGAFYPTSGGSYYNRYGVRAQPEAGRYHEFGLDYEIVIPTFVPPCDQEQVIALGWDIAYSDGMLGVSEWTHTTFNVGLPMMVGPVKVKPYVAYQITMEEDVNDDKNEFYGGLSVSYSF